MYFAIVESMHGEEFIAPGESLDAAVYNLRNMTEDYNPEDIIFFKGEAINVKVEVRFIES